MKHQQWNDSATAFLGIGDTCYGVRRTWAAGGKRNSNIVSISCQHRSLDELAEIEASHY